MIQSMTGFGKSNKILSDKSISLQIKALNSKNLDMNFRLPLLYKSMEIELRKLLSNQLKRGKFEIILVVQNNLDTINQEFNQPLIQSYLYQLKQIAPNTKEENLISTVMRLPNILIPTKEEDLNEEEKQSILDCFKEAAEDLITYRKSEGVGLESEFLLRIQNIVTKLNSIIEIEGERIQKIKDRLQNGLKDLPLQYDENRLEQELIFYLEKLDISEEKQRLQNHCDYFLAELTKEESNGKKLGFILQEIGREINTLGSKSNHSGMQKIVVEMKDELEKIKEQVFNVL